MSHTCLLAISDRIMPKAIFLKEATDLTCLFAQGLRCRFSYIALLCALRDVLPLYKYAAPSR